MNLSRVNKYSILVITIAVVYLIYNSFKHEPEELEIEEEETLGATIPEKVVKLPLNYGEDEGTVLAFERKERALREKRDREKSNSKTKIQESERLVDNMNTQTFSKLNNEKQQRENERKRKQGIREKDSEGIREESSKMLKLQDLKDNLRKDKAHEKQLSEKRKLDDIKKLKDDFEKSKVTQKNANDKKVRGIKDKHLKDSKAQLSKIRNTNFKKQVLNNRLGSSLAMTPYNQYPALGFGWKNIKNAAKTVAKATVKVTKTVVKATVTVAKKAAKKVVPKLEVKSVKKYVPKKDVVSKEKVTSNQVVMTSSDKSASRKVIEVDRKKTDDIANANRDNRNFVIENTQKHLQDLEDVETKRDAELVAVNTILIAKYNQEVARINNSK